MKAKCLERIWNLDPRPRIANAPVCVANVDGMRQSKRSERRR
jgi:hypothetical protein